MTVSNSYSAKLTPDQQDLLAEILKGGNYRPVVVPHTRIAVQADGCNVNLYNSGKLLIQGKGTREFVEFLLEPVVLQAAGLGYEAVLDPESRQPHIGVDESGKGDFFGPMVIAAAYVDETLFEQMEKLGVKDSKAITSDKKAMALGSEIRKLLGKRCDIIKIGPAAYNRLYAKMRSVNRILAWGHAQVIENVLPQVPECTFAISDQFGAKESVERALKQKGRGIKLIQRHKAESDMAVAAASILARERFLRELQGASTATGIDLRKGASALVQAAAVALVKKHGPNALLNHAKCHFRTTDQVLTATGLDRTALPPEGQVVSQAANGMPWQKRSSATEDT
jgi:ribonuclease HIII